MGAGDRQHPLVMQYILREPLWARDVGQVAIKNFFHEQVPTRHHITDNENIWLQGNLLCTKALDQLYSLRLKLCAHRRVHVDITASNTVARLLC